MFTTLKKWWKYLGAKMASIFNERADPKVQLEQAITEAQEQHRRLKEQAANVIANQKQNEMRLSASLEELEKLNRNATQAVLMAEEAAKAGDEAKMQDFTNAAEAFANQLIAKEKEVENLKTMSLQATEAAEKAKLAVQQNSRLLQQKLAEKQKLLSQLDQAKMQEQMNKAMSTLTEEVGQDVPTLKEVQEKIEQRYAKAMGTAELQGMSVESKMLEVEQASLNSEAQARLSEIRSKLGIAEAQAPAAAPATATAAAGGVAAGGAPAAPAGEPEATPAANADGPTEGTGA
jgi:phage shock protein A